jgi:hypothetical protein
MAHETSKVSAAFPNWSRGRFGWRFGPALLLTPSARHFTFLAALNRLLVFCRARFVLAALNLDRASARYFGAAPTAACIFPFVSGSTWHRVNPFLVSQLHFSQRKEFS